MGVSENLDTTQLVTVTKIEVEITLKDFSSFVKLKVIFIYARKYRPGMRALCATTGY